MTVLYHILVICQVFMRTVTLMLDKLCRQAENGISNQQEAQMTQAQAKQTWIVQIGYGKTFKVPEQQTWTEARRSAKRNGYKGIAVYVNGKLSHEIGF